MKTILLCIACVAAGYGAGFWTQSEKFELLYMRCLLLEERLALQGLLLNRMWPQCVGVEEARGFGR